jgi:prepilin-type N-terminal cleavage/methylation domain-containing protein
MTPSCTAKPRLHVAAFTLIELLVVIGVIAILAGAIGVGLAGGNQATDLSTGREILRAHLVAARGQAALNQKAAALIIAADSTDETRNLRYVSVAVWASDLGTWQISAGGASLPGNVWVLPPVSGSSLLTITAAIELDPGQPATNCYILPINANGTLTNGGAGELWVGGGTREAGQIRFDDESPRAGLTLSRYGAISMIDEGGGIAP